MVGAPVKPPTHHPTRIHANREGTPSSIMIRFPRTIGHRGARGYAPENTLAGIRTAAEQGVCWVEVDVKLTRDGVPILMHDDTVDRTTDGRGAVATMDFTDLRRLTPASRSARNSPGNASRRWRKPSP